MKVKRRSFPMFFTAIIFIAILYGAIVVCKGISVRNQKIEIMSENKKNIAELKRDIKNLNSEIKNADSSDFVEKVAREDLGMVKPREVIYVDKNKERDSDKTFQNENIQEDK